MLVAMSGGVDSAVAGLIERERGADVVAVTLKLWADPETDGTKACCSPEAVVGARRLAHSLGLPHFTLDLEEAFRREVVDRFVAGYAAGETPNPCVLCNGDLRIEAMVALADRLGAERLVTGHYARVVDDGDGPLLAPARTPPRTRPTCSPDWRRASSDALRFPWRTCASPRSARSPRSMGSPSPASPRARTSASSPAAEARLPAQPRRDRGPRRADRRPAAAAPSPATAATTTSRSASAAGSASRPASRSTCSKPTPASNTVTVGVREELETTTVRVRDAVLHRDGAAVDSVRLRYHAPEVGAEVAAAPAAGRHAELELRLATPFPGAAPGQTAVLSSKGAIVGHGVIA